MQRTNWAEERGERCMLHKCERIVMEGKLSNRGRHRVNRNNGEETEQKLERS